MANQILFASKRFEKHVYGLRNNLSLTGSISGFPDEKISTISSKSLASFQLLIFVNKKVKQKHFAAAHVLLFTQYGRTDLLNILWNNYPPPHDFGAF